MNQINVIHPYKWEGQWVFDDPDVGLSKEAFVAGADDVCSYLLELVGSDPDQLYPQFTLVFSKDKFPTSQFVFNWLESDEYGGNTYVCPELKLAGWLCPALFKYFETAPAEIHIQAKRHEVIFEKLVV